MGVTSSHGWINIAYYDLKTVNLEEPVLLSPRPCVPHALIASASTERALLALNSGMNMLNVPAPSCDSAHADRTIKQRHCFLLSLEGPLKQPGKWFSLVL